MPVTERHQVDIFGIIVLIATVLILVFLIIAAIYFLNLMNLKPPSRGESTFLFWTAIILAIIAAAIIVYALIHIFNHKSVVYEEPKVAKSTTVVTTPAPVPTTVTTTTAPILISNVPTGTRTSSRSISFSDVPVTSSQRIALNQEELSLGEAVGGP